MIFALPTFSDPFYRQALTLDGTVYLFEFRYSQREALWYLSIFDAEDVELIRGVRMLQGLPVLARYPDARLPPGELAVLSRTSDDSPPGLNDFGIDKRVTLYYLDADEIRAARNNT